MKTSLLLNTFLNILFPPRCLGCEIKISDQEKTLCQNCRPKINLPTTLYCGRCQARLPLAKKICHLDTPYLLGSIAPYEDPLIKKMVLALKFRGLKPTGIFLGHLLAEYFSGLKPSLPLDKKNSVVLPIPLDPWRERIRGFNQSSIIAKTFATDLHLPLCQKGLIRIKNTPPQSKTKTPAERWQHMKSAFAVENRKEINDQYVILVDDVHTTGATLNSAARCLIDAGAKKILALTIAR